MSYQGSHKGADDHPLQTCANYVSQYPRTVVTSSRQLGSAQRRLEGDGGLLGPQKARSRSS